MFVTFVHRKNDVELFGSTKDLATYVELKEKVFENIL